MTDAPINAGYAKNPTKTADPHPKPANPDAGSQRWWLRYLVRQLLLRQPVLDRRAAYVEGRHALPHGDRRYMRALAHLQKLAPTNYVGLATGAVPERMQIRGFRFGDAGTADEDAQSIWAYNDMNQQANSNNQRASKFGFSYMLVSPKGDNDKWPRVTIEDPRTAITCKDPIQPTKSLAGLRMWHDTLAGRVLAVLYMPEGAYGYVGPVSSTLEGMTLEQLEAALCNTAMVGGSGFEEAGFVPNPPSVQEVTLVEFVWKPESAVVPEGECGADVYIIQDRINQTIFDRMCITHYQAYKQRWAAGLSLPKGKRKGEVGTPFDPGLDMLWVSQNEKAKFGEFAAADIRQILEAVDRDVADLAAITKTPAHYLMGKMANISGETLTQAESGLVSKTQQRMSSMGWSYERVMKLCFAFMEDDRATDVLAATLWSDPQRNIAAELALAGTQWMTVGWPLELIMERQGCTPDEIAFAVEKKKEADQLAAQQQQQLLQQTHENNMALASAKPPGLASAGPGKPPGIGTPGSTQKTAAKPGAKPGAAAPTKKPAKKPDNKA